MSDILTEVTTGLSDSLDALYKELANVKKELKELKEAQTEEE